MQLLWSACRPAAWTFADVRAAMLEAGDLITPKEAERRVLVLENPGEGIRRGAVPFDRCDSIRGRRRTWTHAHRPGLRRPLGTA